MLSRVHSVSRVYFIVSMYRCKINPRHLLGLEGWDPRLGGGNIILFIYLLASPGEQLTLASAVKCYLSPHKTRRNLKLARELISQSNELSYTRTANCANWVATPRLLASNEICYINVLVCNLSLCRRSRLHWAHAGTAKSKEKLLLLRRERERERPRTNQRTAQRSLDQDFARVQCTMTELLACQKLLSSPIWSHSASELCGHHLQCRQTQDDSGNCTFFM